MVKGSKFLDILRRKLFNLLAKIIVLTFTIIKSLKIITAIKPENLLIHSTTVLIANKIYNQ